MNGVLAGLVSRGASDSCAKVTYLKLTAFMSMSMPPHYWKIIG